MLNPNDLPSFNKCQGMTALLYLSASKSFSANIYLFKVNNRKNPKKGMKCLKLTLTMNNIFDFEQVNTCWVTGLLKRSTIYYRKKQT